MSKGLINGGGQVDSACCEGNIRVRRRGASYTWFSESNNIKIKKRHIGIFSKHLTWTSKKIIDHNNN